MGGTAVAEPIIIHARPEQATEGYIEIIDVGSGNRVVTVLELLSESNKYPGDGQSQYLRKQREYLAGGVSLVEIDLLRSGKRVLAVPARWVPPSHRTTYQICVVRGWKPAAYEVYRAPLREPLPSIRVPLRQQDADVPLDLQMLIDRCYHHGRYDEFDPGAPVTGGAPFGSGPVCVLWTRHEHSPAKPSLGPVMTLASTCGKMKCV